MGMRVAQALTLLLVLLSTSVHFGGAERPKPAPQRMRFIEIVVTDEQLPAIEDLDRVDGPWELEIGPGTPILREGPGR